MSEQTIDDLIDPQAGLEERSAVVAEPDPSTDEVEEPLGEAGAKALHEMKAKLKGAREELAILRSEKGDRRGDNAIKDRLAEADRAKEELAQMKAKAEGREAEYDLDRVKREAETAALGKANNRIVRAEIRAAAASKLADPADALNFLDLTIFEVDDDGNVDQDDLSEAIADLIKQKPYLAAQGGTTTTKPDRSQGATGNGVATNAQRFERSLEGIL